MARRVSRTIQAVNCPHCGVENEDYRKNCAQCGRALAQVEESLSEKLSSDETGLTVIILLLCGGLGIAVAVANAIGSALN